jgi:hypothetical protein
MGLDMMFRRLGPVGCAHPKAAKDCLLEKFLGGTRLHWLARPEHANATVSFPWGAAWACSEGKAAGPAAGADDPGAELLAALIQKLGTLYDQPDDPARKLLLRAAAGWLAPWPGRLPESLQRLVLELLRHLPMFRRSNGSGIAADELQALLASGATAYVADPSGDGAGFSADLLRLTDAEAALIAKLWPGLKKNLVRTQRPFRIEAAAPAPPQEDAGPRRPSASRAAMIFTGHYSSDVMEVDFGLPADPAFEGEAPKLFSGGKEAPLPDFLAGWRFPAGASFDVTHCPKDRLKPASFWALYGKFFSDAAEHWPLAEPGGLLHKAAVRAMLALLCRLSEDTDLRAQWKDLEVRLRLLPLVRTLGGDWTSLDALASSAAAEGKLVYAGGPCSPVPEEARTVPILEDQRMIARLLGLDVPRALEAFSPAAASAAPQSGAGPEALRRTMELLSGLKGKRGMKIPRKPADLIRLDDGPPLGPLRVDSDGTWGLHSKNPLINAILSSRLAPQEQAVYLASVAFTAFNRLECRVSDADDVRFQEALADLILRRR